jgi:hypothetical protein
MRDSLSSQFQAVFAGACLGEIISNRADTLVAWRTVEAGQYQLGSDLRWSRLLIQTAGQLIVTGQLPPFVESSPALASLPLALFYHDQPTVFHTVLAQLATRHSSTAGLTEAAILGQAASLILRRQLIWSQKQVALIPQVLRDLDLPPPSVELLMQVQSWLEHSVELPVIGRWLKSCLERDSLPEELPLVLALYCFLSTATEFRLSLFRFAQLSRQTSLSPSLRSLVGTLIGALSGLYNGVGGLPLGWRLAWQQSDQSNQFDQSALLTHQLTQTATNPIITSQEVAQLSTQMLAIWSGAAQANWLQQPHLNLTAAPRAIRGAVRAN